jgi:hypothetical protein
LAKLNDRGRRVVLKVALRQRAEFHKARRALLGRSDDLGNWDSQVGANQIQR